MRGLGGRLKARARELGLSDSEIARRLGVGQGRYSSWVNDTHEPDLETLVRVAAVLAMTADEALGVVPPVQGGPDAPLRARAAVALGAMSGAMLVGAVGMLEALARAARDEPPDVPGNPKG